MTRTRVVVVGNGMVGHRFAAKLHDGDRETRFAITVLGEERFAAYDRVQLTRYFSERSPDALSLGGREWYAERGIELRTGTRAVRIDRAAHAVITEAGDAIAYDHLVLATGSSAFVPPIQGRDLPGVFVYRTIDDLDAILAHATSATRAIVVGGGLLGLEAARAMQELALETHVLEAAPRLMPRQLDARGAPLLERTIRASGVHVHLGCAIQRFERRGTEVSVVLGDRTLDADLVVLSAGIRPRDELAREAGLALGERGGIVVDDHLGTTDPRIHAIGECALHRGTLYGLVGPGYEMADVLAARLAGEERAFAGADQSAKLKLLGVDVATFGDAFASEATRSVVLEDEVRGIYKKLVTTDDGKRLLGGMLVGDASDYARLLGLVKSGKTLGDDLAELGLSGGAAANDIGALDDALPVCSCNAVAAGAIRSCVREGAASVGEVKRATCAGTGCGGCLPLVTDLVQAELRSLGRAKKAVLCEHFAFTRTELVEIVQATGARTFAALIASHGRGHGCEICKPTVASILASLHGEPILEPAHATLQDTNDRFLANVQKNGTYSVVPRIPGGEITAEKLIAIGEVAQRYGLYVKITGGQRIDLFGARVDQLPDIWEALIEAGLESGHAYGKAVRTVKSCVGSTWCRYGVQDSTSLAIRIEHRYKGIRAPHKLKSAVSGCIRECAEAQSKDFGLIATEKGWNVYVCGNGGARPRHADLLASDVDEETAVRLVDRFLMFYIRTADRLTRTSVWLDKMDGGIEHLRDVIVRDSLGIAAELERQMDALVGTYRCEWTDVVRDPAKRARFRHFAGEPGGADPSIAWQDERGQIRPAEREIDDVLRESGTRRRLPVLGATSAPPSAPQPSWVRIAHASEVPDDGGIAVRHGEAQLALFHFASRGEWFATSNLCPHQREMVLARGIVGDQGGRPKVACPLHKKTFDLETGACLSGEELSIPTFPVRVEGSEVWALLPDAAALASAAKQCDHEGASEAAE